VQMISEVTNSPPPHICVLAVGKLTAAGAYHSSLDGVQVSSAQNVASTPHVRYHGMVFGHEITSRLPFQIALLDYYHTSIK